MPQVVDERAATETRTPQRDSVRANVETGDLPLPRSAAPPLPRSPRRRGQLLKAAAQFAAVLVPVGIVFLAISELGPATLVFAGITAAIWLASLRPSYYAVHRSPPLQGIGVASALGVVTGLAALSVLEFWIPAFGLEPRELLLMAGAVFVASAGFEWFLERFESPCRVLLVGMSDEGSGLLSDLAQHPHLPFVCVGVIDDNFGDGAEDGLRRAAVAELPEIVMRERPDLIVLGDGQTRARAMHHLVEAASAGFRVVGPHQFYEYAFGKVPVRCLSPDWFMSVLHLYQRRYSRITKRSFDLVFASIGLALVAPFFPVLALLVRLSGPGPIIFRQVRLGEGGNTFEVLKLRTMIESAENDGEPIWATADDARATRVGRFLRSTRLDELPQLWNVLHGEMSFVGPRPERPEFLDALRREVPFWTSRQLIKPGITGWAQVCLGYTSDAGGAAEKLSYDLYYLRHRSILIDLAIITRTVRFVLLGFAAHCRHHFGRGRVTRNVAYERVRAPVPDGLSRRSVNSDPSGARDAGPSRSS
jgi:exopolysaccharide biosynthesis polyprenyl glycosylphosphotransferase